ncbi:aladin isoform X1 [Gossypium australe]|uniref:Aladin isoform X1 n=1 Tax=Gossypium australe TaxID=47621 RepID=A0A5B6VT45_9ROSI|nr:aladin isoform X1 [Gossypium australe]
MRLCLGARTRSEMCLLTIKNVFSSFTIWDVAQVSRAFACDVNVLDLMRGKGASKLNLAKLMAVRRRNRELWLHVQPSHWIKTKAKP